MKRSYIKRSTTPIPKKRTKPRRGDPTPLEKEERRREVYERDNHCCVDCHRWVIWESGFWNSMHLMHIKSRGAGGSWELSNLLTGCPECHMKRHNCGGKPCSSKVKE
jgi:5-methylcytosine-specific restriction endonuclease McrA